MGLGARWHEIARTYADVNMAFGDIVKVTPSSKVVGDMAIFLVNHDMTIEQFERLGPDHNLTLPGLGDRDVQRGRWASPRAAGRNAAEDHPARRQAAARPPRRAPAAGGSRGDRRRCWRSKIGREPAHDEVLSYLMYPDVFLKFARSRGRAMATWTCCRRRSSTTAWSAATKSPWNWSRARRW